MYPRWRKVTGKQVRLPQNMNKIHYPNYKAVAVWIENFILFIKHIIHHKYYKLKARYVAVRSQSWLFNIIICHNKYKIVYGVHHLIYHNIIDNTSFWSVCVCGFVRAWVCNVGVIVASRNVLMILYPLWTVKEAN